MATFTAMDPEGAGVTWAVEGADKSKFDITGGVLTFKESPNFEMPGDVLRPAIVDDENTDVEERVVEPAGNNVYELTVRASEIQAEGADGNAMSAAADITVTVTDVNEPGMAEITLRQPEVDQSTTTPLSVIYSDPDVGQNPAEPTALVTPMFSWYVPKVSRPVTENDDHWQPATNTTNTAQAYTPAAGDEDRFLRVKVTYTDAAGDETRSVYAKSESRHVRSRTPTRPQLSMIRLARITVGRWLRTRLRERW